jgi:long-chain acyl-CoA synthetase
MTSLNLASVLEHRAKLTPQATAITCSGAHLTYAELEARASSVAGGLASLGIRPGDHVALSCPNLPAFPVAYFGILKAGAVVVPLNVLLKPREIAYHLRDSDARALIVFEGTAELPMAQMARAGCDDAGCPLLIVITLDPAAPAKVSPALTLGQIMHTHAGPFATVPREADDTAVILYTSGTTGQSKGAELTHLNMVSNAVANVSILRPAMRGGLEQDVMLVTLPLFHSTAQTCQMNAGLYGGCRLVLSARFEPQTCLQLMEQEHVGFWIGVPTMYWALLQYVASTGADPTAVARNLRVCASGGAPMPHDVMRRFESVFRVRILEGYGLSETAPVVSFNQVERPTKPGTVGLPVFGVEFQCVDEEDRPVPAGQPGEVVVRGTNVMKGYYKRPEESAAALRGGWFHTGDIGSVDADGYLTIVDRKKDMILRGGFNVYPRELEEVIMTHPAVALVAVIGIPDERLGEEVKAIVVRRPDVDVTAEGLVEWCREQFAAYKYPRHVEFREALPIGATGKILKRELRAPAR